MRLNILVWRNSSIWDVTRLHMDLAAKTQLLKQVPYFRSLPLGEVQSWRHVYRNGTIAPVM